MPFINNLITWITSLFIATSVPIATPTPTLIASPQPVQMAQTIATTQPQNEPIMQIGEEMKPIKDIQSLKESEMFDLVKMTKLPIRERDEECLAQANTIIDNYFSRIREIEKKYNEDRRLQPRENYQIIWAGKDRTGDDCMFEFYVIGENPKELRFTSVNVNQNVSGDSPPYSKCKLAIRLDMNAPKRSLSNYKDCVITYAEGAYD